ncbi:hypothetical protein [Ruegeria conchae]|uniref:hypothetical protein n=1 Tax=Ruegeria conchae TaxID=981384 RepID=UPI0035CD1CB0
MISKQTRAEFPAEHNVGHLYAAKPDLATFYKWIDPTNSMYPGIGKCRETSIIRVPSRTAPA